MPGLHRSCFRRARFDRVVGRYFERAFAAGPTRCFAGGEGVGVQAFEIDARVGGHERAVYSATGGGSFGAEGVYHDIVPCRRIVSAYSISADDPRISTSLSTVELHPSGTGTRLVYTERAAFYEGGDGPQTREQGRRALLGQLAEALDQVAPGSTITAPGRISRRRRT